MMEEARAIADRSNEESDTRLADGKYLTFVLGEHSYGVEILRVQEIIQMMPVTPVPNTPDFIRGVINLRGVVIPVVDLRARFTLAAREDTDRTCIIVLQAGIVAGKMRNKGIIVDTVSEVLDIPSSQLEAPPSLGEDIDLSFIRVMGKVNQRVVTVLDVDAILSGISIKAAEAEATQSENEVEAQHVR